MRNSPNVKVDRYRVSDNAFGEMGNNGAFIIPCGKVGLRVISSNGMGWDHVSVSLSNRCPTWDEMDFIKNLFFKDDEAVMQLHPPRKNWVNNHPFCLHLWRPQTAEEMLEIQEECRRIGMEYPMPLDSEGILVAQGKIPLPPNIMVGIQELGDLTHAR